VAFTFGLSLVTAVLFGLAPAWQLARTDMASSLKDRTGETVRGGRILGLRNLLIIGQVAVSLVLVSGAGLLLRSVLRIQNVNLGFDHRDVVLVTVALDHRGEPPAKTESFTEDLLARVKSLPGIQNAAFTFWVPLGLGQMNLETKLDGYTPSPNERVAPQMNLVGPGFFKTLRVPLVSGRSFSTSGHAGAGEVVIDEAMAHRYWPHSNPMGRRLQNIFGSFEIVGVARSMKYVGFTEPPRPMFFLPLSAWFKKTTPPTLTLLARARTGPRTMLNRLRRELTVFAPDLPIIDAKTMDEHLALRAFPTRFAAVLTGAFAVLALVLAAVGLYGVMSYFVNQRTREFGIRMALGAQRRDILGLVAGQGLLVVGLGALAGLAGAFAAGRLLGSLLFGLSPTDPFTFLAAAVLLAAVALLACYIPARRAAKVSPMVALRTE
jgi:putative ABC transport system permease protein